MWLREFAAERCNSRKRFGTLAGLKPGTYITVTLADLSSATTKGAGLRRPPLQNREQTA